MSSKFTTRGRFLTVLGAGATMPPLKKGRTSHALDTVVERELDITLDKAQQTVTCSTNSSSRFSRLSPPSAASKRLSTALFFGSLSRVALCYSTAVRRLRAAREKGRRYTE